MSDKKSKLKAQFRQLVEDYPGDKDDLAELIGRSVRTIDRYLNPDDVSAPSEAVIWAIKGSLEQETSKRQNGERHDGSRPGRRDPIYDVVASAGTGSYEVQEQTKGYILGSDALSAPGRPVFWIMVKGDSMGDRYRKGMLIPCLRFSGSMRDIREDDVYLFRLEHAIQIKRLQRLTGSRIRIISDNPAYPIEEIIVDEGLDFEVLGRVLV